MRNAVLRYDPAIPKLAEIPDLIQSNPLYSTETRSADASLVKKVCRWLTKAAAAAPATETAAEAHPTPATVPFTRMYLKAAFLRLTPATVGTGEKNIDNALSQCNRIADTLGMPPGYVFVPLTEPCLALQAKLKAHEDRGACVRIFRFLSARQLDPFTMSDALVPDFKAEIDGDWRVKDKEREFKRALYAWNHAVKTVDGWPEVRLTMPIIRVIWGKRWAYFERSLETAVDDFLARGSDAGKEEDLFAGPDVLPLEDVTKKGQKESFRMGASALLHAKFKSQDLVGLRDLIAPERFKTIFRVLTKRTGVVNATIMKYARDLRKAARHAGILTEPEVKVINEAYKKLVVKHKEFLKTKVDRDQELLDKLDNDDAMDALLALAHREVERVKRSKNPYTVGNAYRIQKALVLEIWWCAPLRISKVLALQLSQLFTIKMAGVETVLLRPPMKQSTNKRMPEHTLSTAAAELLDLYLDKFLPIILEANKCESSPYLFPGEGGKQKCYQTLSMQIKNLVHKKTGLTKFHPHVVRKIQPKIVIDANPAARDSARRNGGWVNERMLRDRYEQRNQRAGQNIVNNLVQGRKLRAIGPLRRRRARNSKKAD